MNLKQMDDRNGMVRKTKQRTFHNWPELTLRAVSLGFISLFIILPLVAISKTAFQGGMIQLWHDIMQPEAFFSIQLSFSLAFIMIGINAVFGTLTAWVLVRYEFPGKSVLNALIDLPFAIPTIVTGLMLVVLYGPGSSIGTFLSQNGVEIVYAKPGIVLALLFVTLPFVVRTVQPVLMEMDLEMEEAAETLGASRIITFWRIVLPSILPAILTGSAQAFSRALGEFGSVVMVAGNIPMKTQVAPVFIYGEIESYSPRSALAVSVVLLAGSLLVLLLMNILQKWGRKYDDI